MSRLIRENDVYALFAPNGLAHLHVGHIDVLPRVDAKPIVHARWISRPGTLGDWYCSNCDGVLLYEVENYSGGNYHDIKTVWSAYCPHCGAQMDEEDK